MRPPFDIGPRRTLARIALYAFLISPALIPVVCPYPPFQDWAAHAGLIGLLARAGDPATRIAGSFEYVGALKLNCLIYLTGAAAAKVVSPFVAANLVLGLSLGSLGPAVAGLCRVLRADERAAVLAVPIAIGRHVYCGFITDAAALTLFVVVFALALRVLRRPSRWPWGAALVVTSVLSSLAHGFIHLAAAGLLAVLIARYAMDPRRRKRTVWPALALLISLGVFALLYAQGTGYYGERTSTTALEAIVTAIGAPRSEQETFWRWLFAFRPRSRLDDGLQVAWCLVVIVWLVRSWARRRRRIAVSPAADVALLVLVTWVTYLILPTYIGAPLHWWAADLRLPPIIVLLPLALLRPRPRWPGAALAAAALVVSFAVLADCLVELRRWDREEMDGFSEVVDSVPQGRLISTLIPHLDSDYPGEPEFYFTNYYLLRRGGPVPGTFTDRADWPYRRRSNVPEHGWGHLHSFRPSEHVPLYDGFIVRFQRTPVLPGPFGALAGTLRVVTTRGHWAYVERAGHR